MSVERSAATPKRSWKNVFLGRDPVTGKKFFEKRRVRVESQESGPAEPPSNFEGTEFLTERPPTQAPVLRRGGTHASHVAEALEKHEPD